MVIDGMREEKLAVISAEHGRSTLHVECFADEVVIDFPSVAPAIERMRRAFVDEGPHVPLPVELLISPRQAFEGATVLLEVPVRCTCGDCGGRGESWPDPCARCHGTGLVVRRHQVEISVPARVADRTRFRFSIAPRHDPPTHIELHVAIR